MANTVLAAGNATPESEHKLALDTARLSAQGDHCANEIQLIIKDEELRKLRVRILLLEDEVDHLSGQLSSEEERSEALRQDLDANMDQLDDYENRFQDYQNELRMKSRELEILKMELSSMSHASTDATKILTEKLSLAREVAVLKPELESLRAQAMTQKDILAEKLSLQRQLSTVQVELENAQRTLDRSAAKQAKNHDRTEIENQLDEMSQQLDEANRLRKKAEREVERLNSELEVSTNERHSRVGQSSDLQSQVEELQRQLHQSEKDRLEVEQRIEEASSRLAKAPAGEKKSKREEKVDELRTHVATLQKQLANETAVRIALEAEHNKFKSSYGQLESGGAAEDVSSHKRELEHLRLEHAVEKKERQKIQKAFEKSQTSWEAEKATLDDKLEAFRKKLRSTKEKLKNAESQIEEINATSVMNKSDSQSTSRTNPKKRGAAQIDDTMLGTPGDGPQLKRNKLAGAIVSRASATDKSSFSITPFLNRTLSIAPESPEAAAEEQPTALKPTMEETTDSPSSNATKPKIGKPKPLKPASSSKHNVGKPARAASTLDKVIEEPSMLVKSPSPRPVQSIELDIVNENVTVTKVPTATGNQPTMKLKAKSLKPRKSLMSFASFVEEAAPEKKKKRKLGGASAPKTLFDEDDEEKLPSKPIPGRGVFAAKGLGKPFLFGKQKSRLDIAKEPVHQFSPLKKDRKR